MRRKVNRVGQNTLTVSLPAMWVKENNLVQGQEIDVHIIDADSLKISLPDGNKKPAKDGSVDFSMVSPLTAKCSIDMIYILGYDSIEILTPSEEVRSILQRRTQQLVGYTVIEQRKDRCKVKNITTGLSADFDPLLRRLFLVLLSMFKEGGDALRSGGKEELSSLAVLEESVNQLVHSSLRLLARGAYPEKDKVMPYYVLIWYLEAIGDDLRDLFNLRAQTKNIDKSTISLFEQARSYFADFYAVFYKHDPVLLDTLYEKRAHFNEYKLAGSKDVDLARRILMIPQRLFDVLPIAILQLPIEEI